MFMGDISVVIEGGKATAAAPLGPALGPMGVNIGEVVARINEKTNAYAGMKIPVVVSIDPKTKAFEIKVGSPSASSLIKKEAGIQKGASVQAENAGNISMEQLKKIVGMKIDKMSSSSLKSAAKEIAGTCKQMGITIEGKDPKEVIKEINEGKHDSLLG